MKIVFPHSHRAFTILEALVVILIVVLVLAMFLPTLARPQRRSNRIGCVNYLKQIGIAVRVWHGDNNDKYPMNVPIALGGARELLAAGNVAACFQVMSNELSTPKILVCPADKQRKYATNFDTILTRTNISYFLALNASESDPQAILSGDDNLIQNHQPVSPGIVKLSTSPATWTSDRHQGAGFILVADGSVQSVRQMGFVSSAGTCFATNRIVVP
jgi:competence protein ComGC